MYDLRIAIYEISYIQDRKCFIRNAMPQLDPILQL
jgi:hypothetical protein